MIVFDGTVTPATAAALSRRSQWLAGTSHRTPNTVTRWTDPAGVTYTVDHLGVTDPEQQCECVVWRQKPGTEPQQVAVFSTATDRHGQPFPNELDLVRLAKIALRRAAANA